MKKQILPACVMLVLSLVITVGSLTFLGPCVHEDGTAGACTWAARALLALGCVLAVISAAAFVSRRARFGAYLSGAAVCAVLTPGTFISLCRMDTMRCRAVMRPAMILLFGAAALCCLAGALLCAKEERKGMGRRP